MSIEQVWVIGPPLLDSNGQRRGMQAPRLMPKKEAEKHEVRALGIEVMKDRDPVFVEDKRYNGKYSGIEQVDVKAIEAKIRAELEQEYAAKSEGKKGPGRPRKEKADADQT